VPAWTVLSLFGSMTILICDRHNIAWADLMRLLPSCMLGIAIGLFFFAALDSRTLAQAPGVVTLLHGGLSLWASMRPADATVSPDSSRTEGAISLPNPSRYADALGSFCRARRAGDQPSSARRPASVILIWATWAFHLPTLMVWRCAVASPSWTKPVFSAQRRFPPR